MTCRHLKLILSRIRALGLTRPGGPAAGLPDDFTVSTSDIPYLPGHAEPSRDLPPEIMRQLCDQLPALECQHGVNIRTIVELAIDTGRRPDEICTLAWDCLTRDSDGSPVLIYDNHKAGRMGRRLPVTEATATLITGQKQRTRDRYPRALVSDTEAVRQLIRHRYFQPHVTPLQIFNRATDPFLPAVRLHTLAVLAALDARELRNHVLVITRHQMRREDITQLNELVSIRLTLLFTYSGIDDKRIEPYPSHVAAESLKLMSAPSPRRYRTILYWRPLVPGLNDSDEHLDRAHKLSLFADATVFTGLFYRDEIAAYYRANGLPEPYGQTARRKIVPETLERRVLTAFADSASLFRKTSCAVSFVHGLPDYNGHYGIRELCDICPLGQLDRCRDAHRIPSAGQIHDAARALPEARGLTVASITSRAAAVTGLPGEQPRYYLQHALNFQVHDAAHPHHRRRHGRADVGWEAADD